MPLWNRRPLLRWAVPLLAALLLIGGGAAISSLSASADTTLPERTAGQLLVDVQQARISGLSGTVVQNSDLGIPDLPGVGGAGSSDLTSLISGTHTMKVWSSGPDKARLALLGTLGESDVIQNGKDVWLWSSKDNTASHYTVTPSEQKHPRTETPKTPQQAADAALAAIDPSTEVTVADNVTVAGRPAYELVLTPRDSASLVAQVRIAIDGAAHVPTRVQLWADGGSKPAFQVGFTQVNFTRPDAAQFTFNPPPGATVKEVKPGSTDTKRADRKAHTQAAPKVVGKGWTTVVVAKAPAPAAGSASGPRDLQRMLNALPRVSGSWGSGRLLAGTAFSVLVTDDGTVVAGAVRPSALYAALGSR
ncbi:outer membrane lipoprotein carrier protein LolA [Microlunatus panaciterrae]|uniref:Outer membrane lipoprotein-sorting protein n=1 Tax=Microlunatus panaciterrae TaxID=400768 RepID=A0ABS2RLP7_9ACTN|nr:hypothetical protein [Microlunatus panaciterrae]MBM7798844.1 outer membrane lipoprotein-sorting protein [Microlunatus panaciterrae]